ncbi:MAG: RluA family pseudouridine synthase [Prevotella sp.]|jgi:23S rRNA pseudouridine1911/1915/1917 synthase|nr:RluA family pseudouridine synthase [Prevotella sp.]
MQNKPDNTILQTCKVAAKSELLIFLQEKQVRESRSAVKSLLAHKQVKVNGQTVSQFDRELQAGDVVTIHKTSHARDPKKLKGLTIVYEDDYLLVIDKDAGMLSIATEREKRETAYSIVSDYLKRRNKDARVFVLHRLDRETSGLMMFAKAPDIQEIMQKNWDNLIRVRSYAAVVEGQPKPADGTIESWLTEDKNYKMHSSATDNGGQHSVTNYKTSHSIGKFTLLRLELDTGRKNQIRVHLQHIGHPVVGDKKYGSRISTIKRVALHAHELHFSHPVTNELLEFTSPIPAKMLMLVENRKMKMETNG